MFGGLARNRTRTQGSAVSFEALFQPIDQAVAGTRNPPLAIRLDERAVKSAPAPATGGVRYGDDEVTDSAGCRSRLAYKRARPDLVESGMRHVSREALHWSSSVSLRRTPLPPAPLAPAVTSGWVCWVQPDPSHQRSKLGVPYGSGYQPEGGKSMGQG